MMKKNVLILLFALCFAFAVFPSGVQAGSDPTVYVGNTDVTPAEMEVTYYWQAAESGDNAYAATGSEHDFLFSVTYHDSTGITLTLNGVDITTFSTQNYGSINYATGIYSDWRFNLVLQGENTIDNSEIECGVGFYGGGLEISGSGSLTIPQSSYGIYVDGSALMISGGTIDISANYSGIWANNDLTIRDGTVDISSDNSGISCHNGELSISGGNVNISSDNICVSVTGNMNISGGVVTARTGHALFLAENLTVPVAYKFKASLTAADPGGNYTIGGFINPFLYKYVEIVTCPDVYVSGNNVDNTAVKVSSVTDAGDISYWLNDNSGGITPVGADSTHYNVKYEEKTQTLTLKDAMITKYYYDDALYGVYAADDLHVILEGDSQIGAVPTGEDFDTPAFGIHCDGNLTVSATDGGTIDVYAKGTGLDADDSIQLKGGTISISAAQTGIISNDDDVTVSGKDTSLRIEAGSTNSSDAFYGIMADGKVTIADAALDIEKKGITGDAVRSNDDICIYGDANVKIVDWSTGDAYEKCGLHSDKGSVSVGEAAKVDICSQYAGIFARQNLYIGYVPEGSDFVVSGDPTVKTNNTDSINAITPEIADDFVPGGFGLAAENDLYFANGTVDVFAMYSGNDDGYGICATEDGTIHILGGTVASEATGGYSGGIIAVEGNIDISGGAVEAVGSYCALYCDDGILTLPSTDYKYKSSTTAADPGGAYISGAYTYSAADKYVNIASILDITKETASHGSYAAKIGNDEVTAAAIGETVLLTAAPDSGYFLSSWTVSKTEDPSVTLDVTDDTFTMPAYPVTVAAVFTDGMPYYVRGDQEIFIGFAANGKHIAPDGVTVLFKDNHKTFTDIKSHWAYSEIDFVTEREIFLGTGNGKFSPETKMTRAMFATVLGRLYERSYEEIAVVSTGEFGDCNYDSWYGKYVNWAEKNGIVNGYGHEKFGPGDAITREEMTVMLYRFANYLNLAPDADGSALHYADAAAISGWAKNAALYCQNAGIVIGFGNGRFLPQNPATRAEVSAVIQRFITASVK